MSFLLPIHIAAGILAIVFGFVALLAPKGAAMHRRIGLLFVYAMLVMGTLGSLLALRKSWTNANVIGGFMSAYFVITALTTVRAASEKTRWLNRGALLVAVSLSIFDVTMGIKALSTPRGTLDGVPFFMFFFLGSITALAAIGDVRVMRSGPLLGGKRLARHLWRMCFALFISAGSFFSIRARVAKLIPDVWITPALQVLPTVVIFVAMFYWLWRVRSRRRPIPQRG